MALHVIVLAGGSGTRLWPLSRRDRPKHLLPLGPGGIPLLTATVRRVIGLSPHVHVVTASDQAEACRRAVPGDAEVDVIEEPVARGTGPALALATEQIARGDPEAVIASVHADHHIGDDTAYRAAAIAAAGWAATTGGFATVGIQPAAPATGFGYIEIGRALPAGEWRSPRQGAGSPLDAARADDDATPRGAGGAQGAAGSRDAGGGDPVASAAAALPAHEVVSFIEKPTEDVARRFLDGGRHLWNLGLFAWSAAVFRRELGLADQALATAVGSVVEARAAGDEPTARARYEALPTVAVEPLLMERGTRMAVVRAAFAWSDLGSWPDILAARLDEGRGDAAGNVTEGGVAVASANCLVSGAGGRLVAVVGAEGLIVVDTGDAVLVVPAARAQQVKELTAQLPSLGRDDLR